MTAQSTSASASRPDSTAPIRIAYLVSEYPGISHTFILREVRQLQGAELPGFGWPRSIHPTACLNTWRTKSRPKPPLPSTSSGPARGPSPAPIWRSSRESPPHAYISGLLFALRLAGTDLQRIVFFAIFYFIEAVTLGQWMKSQRLSHLHVHFATAASTVGLIASPYFPDRVFVYRARPRTNSTTLTNYRLAEKIAGASFIVCIGYFARSQMMKLVFPPVIGASSRNCSPPEVDPAVFKPDRNRRLGECFEILMVGRLVPAKGQHVLISAVDRLIKMGRNVRLLMVGRRARSARVSNSRLLFLASAHTWSFSRVPSTRIISANCIAGPTPSCWRALPKEFQLS